MFGDVISVDEATGDGVILGEDRQSYPFSASACRGRLKTGQKVEFSVRDGAAVQVFKLFAARHSLGLKPSETEVQQQQEFDRAAAAPLDWGFLLGSLHGRIGRQPFIGIWVALNIAGVILGLIPAIGSGLALALLWPRVAIQTKRLHDLGLSGWLQVIPIALAIVSGGVIYLSADASYMGSVLPILTWFLNFGFFVWLAATVGQSGPNRFGDDPRRNVEEVFA